MIDLIFSYYLFSNPEWVLGNVVAGFNTLDEAEFYKKVHCPHGIILDTNNAIQRLEQDSNHFEVIMSYDLLDERGDY